MGRKNQDRWSDNPTSLVIDLEAARINRERIEKLRAAKIARRKPKGKKRIPSFYDTPEWKRARYKALKASNGRCSCCGAGPLQGAVLNVDHIIARTKRPDLALKQSNLQVLCASCNEGKGWRDETDWREPSLRVLMGESMDE